jgi:hypothetical protein
LNRTTAALNGADDHRWGGSVSPIGAGFIGMGVTLGVALALLGVAAMFGLISPGRTATERRGTNDVSNDGEEVSGGKLWRHPVAKHEFGHMPRSKRMCVRGNNPLQVLTGWGGCVAHHTVCMEGKCMQFALSQHENAKTLLDLKPKSRALILHDIPEFYWASRFIKAHQAGSGQRGSRFSIW